LRNICIVLGCILFGMMLSQAQAYSEYGFLVILSTRI